MKVEMNEDSSRLDAADKDEEVQVKSTRLSFLEDMTMKCKSDFVGSDDADRVEV